jgi:hypothetical protein
MLLYCSNGHTHMCVSVPLFNDGAGLYISLASKAGTADDLDHGLDRRR